MFVISSTVKLDGLGGAPRKFVTVSVNWGRPVCKIKPHGNEAEVPSDTCKVYWELSYCIPYSVSQHPACVVLNVHVHVKDIKFVDPSCSVYAYAHGAHLDCHSHVPSNTERLPIPAPTPKIHTVP